MNKMDIDIAEKIIDKKESAEVMENKNILKINYDKNDFVSKPYRVENGTVPMDILEFNHSYGYDCQRYFNICVVDPNTIIFASGCLIHIFDTVKKTLQFRRGSTGKGIGHIAKNPTIAHIAVGENGKNPPIIIYEWPSFEIITVLYEGTTKFYSHLSYSPDGDLLVSQGGDPDHLITVWKWKQSSIILRCKSHSQDIYNVMFSSSIPGHITTSGAGHIKFWQMASTFTGLKLKGELGRFSRTEISDIIGVLAMPDGKIVSGCEWGNILLWDEGLIKLEVRRKSKKSCHAKMITQFEYNNGELMSIGTDGWIRVWYYETIDQADPPDDDRFVNIEPIYEFRIGEKQKNENDDDITGDSMLMSVQKKEPDNPEDTLWYAQDGNGGLWLIDLNTFQSAAANLREKLFTCHAGAVNDIAACTWGEFIATIGKDGRLNIYNYLKKKIIISRKFRDDGTCVIWFSCAVESTGSTIVCAFKSGIVRIVTISIEGTNKSEKNENQVRLIHVTKPHTKPITNMSVNPSNSLLVTGSEDSTIFIFSIKVTEKYPLLVPIGFVNVPSSITCMTWKPKHLTTILIGCLYGDCVEIDLPNVPQSYTTVSYELTNCEKKIFKFHSVKSKIRREQMQMEIEKNKAARKQIRYEKMEELKANNPLVEIDEETFLMDTEEDPPLPDIYIPEIPNRVLTINYSTVDTIYLTMAGFDAGFIYEYSIPQNNVEIPEEPMKSTEIYDAIDTEIRSCLYYDNEFLIMGMEQGEIRVCHLKKNNLTDLSDYWIFPMHDPSTGYIPKIILNYDNKMLFTCGHDGNIFSFIVNTKSLQRKINREHPAPPHLLPEYDIDDIEETDSLNLEQIINKNEENKIMFEAKKKKDHVLMVLRELSEKYYTIIEENNTLPESQKIPQDEFELDSRITDDLNDQLKSEMDLVYKKMAFKVEKCHLALKKLTDQFIKPITCIPFAVSRILKPNRMLHSLREEVLDENFATNYAELLEQIKKRDSIIECELAEKNKLIKSVDDKPLIPMENEVEEQTMEGAENIFGGLSPSIIEQKMTTQMNHLLKKYQERKEKNEKRAREWKLLNASKPDPNEDHQKDIEAIEEAEQTIGDYKLKIFMNFNLNKKLTTRTTLDKHKQLLDCRKKTHDIRVNFNERLKAVRNEKIQLQSEILNLIEKLKLIHVEIPENYIKKLPEILEINYSIECPEKNLELEKYITIADKVKEARRIRKSSENEAKTTPMDKEYEVLLLDEKLIKQNLKNKNKLNFPSNFTIYEAEIHISDDLMQSLAANDEIESAWEREMKLARMEKKIYEQDRIIDYINRSYETIDKKLNELERERLVIQVDSCYSELYQLTLQQELIILRDCEVKENHLTEKVNENLTAQSIVKQKIQQTTLIIDNKNKENAKIQEIIRELSSQFSNMISNNKFTEFLRRIFKKKYKLPKVTEDTSIDSSSSNDLTSSEDDGVSIDSQEFELYHLDENICPTGCDQVLYNAAFSMRTKRHEYEFQIKDNTKIISSLKREVAENTKKLKAIENSLNTSQQELLTFMQEKQKKLNEIEATVILNLNQMQHFVNNETLANIRDCVVFDKGELSRLYTRVNQLHQETIDQKEKHKKAQTHLSRLEIDCKYMDGEIKRLNEEINEAMFNKFGRQIPLTDLYEAVLRRMMVDIKSDMKEIIKSYDKEINCVKEKYNGQVIILENLIQDNTEKLSLLKILMEEHAKLRKILKRNFESEESMAKTEDENEKELAKLETILKNQRQQKKLFRNEIRNLRLKSCPLPPIYSRRKSEKSYSKILKLEEENKFDEINKDREFFIHQSRIVSDEKITSKFFTKELYNDDNDDDFEIDNVNEHELNQHSNSRAESP